MERGASWVADLVRGDDRRVYREVSLDRFGLKVYKSGTHWQAASTVS